VENTWLEEEQQSWDAYEEVDICFDRGLLSNYDPYTD
jgi:hypothetical protein